MGPEALFRMLFPAARSVLGANPELTQVIRINTSTLTALRSQRRRSPLHQSVRLLQEQLHLPRVGKSIVQICWETLAAIR